jgi:type I restriction enzyme S subunit
MKVKLGYKQTEVGVIPKDWEVVDLGEKTEKIGSGITPTGGEKVYHKKGHPFIRSQNVGLGKLFFDDIAYIEEKTHQSVSSR